MIPRFLASTNHEQNKFNLLFLHLDVSSSKNEYKTTVAQVDLNQVNWLDMIKWHMQTREMVSWKVIKYTANVKKLQALLNKVDKQLENERIKNKARITRSKDLENKLSILAIDNNGAESVKRLLGSKETARSRFWKQNLKCLQLIIWSPWS